MVSGSLPSPPATLARIIGAAGDPEVSVQGLGRLIAVDPALSASVLGVANSATYGMGRPVRSVKQAAVLLGFRAIRNLAVSQAVRSATDGVDTGAFDLDRFWEDSLRRATAAVVIARRAGYQDLAEAFTVGLIQDLGSLAMAVQWPEHGETLQAAMDHTITYRLECERRLTGTTHPDLFVTLGKGWGLPEEFVAVIAGHHSDETLADRRDERLRSIASVADAVADVVQTQGNSGAIASATRALGDLGSREHLELESVLEQVGAAMSAAAVDMKIQIGAQPSFQELMSRANEVLININTSYEEITQKLQESNLRLEDANRQLQEALSEKQELARQLEASNQTLRRLAATDVLTGVANRRAFTTVLAQRISSAQESGEWVSLI
ncbi:MAG: HDOD domain-containing protein, partial [Dehalococcoidia bacterium]